MALVVGAIVMLLSSVIAVGVGAYVDERREGAPIGRSIRRGFGDAVRWFSFLG